MSFIQKVSAKTFFYRTIEFFLALCRENPSYLLFLLKMNRKIEIHLSGRYSNGMYLLGKVAYTTGMKLQEE